MSLRKQVRSKNYMDEVFQDLNLGEKSRYGINEFKELGEVIGVKYVGGVGTAQAIDSALTPEPEPEVTIWTLTLQLNGGECFECGNAEGGEGFVVATGSTEETIDDVFNLEFANLAREGYIPNGLSYDEAGEEPVGELDAIDVPNEITIWAQWTEDII
jgi:hypothetical protein